ncbi:MAG: ATP-binding protein [Muribaculaceae bacterium]|nr:ATP-binding protein [Muribaculaceae bacterium]
MKDIHANRASFLVQRLIAEGEHISQDFKYTVNDPRKIARSVSAFANRSGGRLLIGVNDNGQPRGVKSEEDIWVVESAASVYCKPAVEVEFTAYKVDQGALIIRADIAPAATRPVYVVEADGSRRAYYRVDDENIAAHPLMVKAWRHQADPRRETLIDFSPERSALIDRLGDGPATPEDLVATLHLSKPRFEALVTDLYALDVIEFTYLNRRFHLALNTD